MPMPRLDASAMEALLAYSWPGNVRELRNIAERLVLEEFGRAATADDLRLPRPSEPRTEAAPVAAESRRSGQLWDQFEAGLDFWTVVYQPFKQRELTRRDVIELMDDGLSRTGGSYRHLLRLFNLPDGDYKRFHAFLRQQNCTLDVRRYRPLASDGQSDQRAASTPSVREAAAESSQ